MIPKKILKSVPVLVTLVCLFAGTTEARQSLGFQETMVVGQQSGQDFPLVTDDKNATLWHDSNDHKGVIRAIQDLQADIEQVTDKKLSITHGEEVPEFTVIIGTLGKSSIIDELAESGKLETKDIKGKWESFVITTISNPKPGIKQALVIAGSDKRGTIYGIYELSEQMGVSPWHWWADVPPKKREQAFVVPGYYTSGEPVVRYRGIFLNNEWPNLGNWTQEKYGSMNSEFYAHVFELLLRLRANYLWPAMWNSAFNEDDSGNPRLADEYGIVMGTSHHEPMVRAHKEWTRRNEEYGNGEWNYFTNGEALRQFWREGIARNKEYENLVTVGMRGDGDLAMPSTGSMEEDIKLLEGIINDQREILREEMGVDPSDVPQLWALFTEVQKFYEAGMQVPDDVTLLWTDDNVGNLRRLPTKEEQHRSGGNGIYYHFDMHGGPYSYQWINTNNFPKIREQMNLAYQYNANRIWIVNVGDLKPMELPIEFFLRLAWNPKAIGKDDIDDYTLRWAERDFGSEYAADIADIVTKYAKYNSWRKPDLLTPETFSVMHNREAERMQQLWGEIADKAEKIYTGISPDKKDAFYQLVYYPIKAVANIVEMNIASGLSQFYARQGRLSSNEMADKVQRLFELDADLSDYYNHELADGKWNHMMDQPHIGQFGWEPPRLNILPPVSGILPMENNNYGVAIEGDINAWPGHYGAAVLPSFDSFTPRKSYVEVFAEGTLPIAYNIEAKEPWIVVTKDSVERIDDRYWVEIDWEKAPSGKVSGSVLVTGTREPVIVQVNTLKATETEENEAEAHFASNTGVLVLRAKDAAKKINVHGVRWEEIPGYGRTEAAISMYPVTAESILPPEPAPTLEYPVYLPEGGNYEVTLIIGPVMDFVPDRGMRVAVAFDDEEPKVLDLFENRASQTFLGGSWYGVAQDNVRRISSVHNLKTKGKHTLKVSMVDPAVVLEKIIIRPVNVRLPASYFSSPSNSLYLHKN